MALTVQLQLNLRAKPFVPTVKANKLLQHRRGKREEGEASVSKHQTQLGRVRWASRRGEGEPNPPRETKNSGANMAEIGGRCAARDFFYFFSPSSAGHDRDWPPCKVILTS